MLSVALLGGAAAAEPGPSWQQQCDKKVGVKLLGIPVLDLLTGGPC
ncbi:hypothetical protein ABZ135_37075 [Streptomyces sp. NPDC006339]